MWSGVLKAFERYVLGVVSEEERAAYREIDTRVHEQVAEALHEIPRAELNEILLNAGLEDMAVVQVLRHLSASDLSQLAKTNRHLYGVVMRTPQGRAANEEKFRTLIEKEMMSPIHAHTKLYPATLVGAMRRAFDVLPADDKIRLQVLPRYWEYAYYYCSLALRILKFAYALNVDRLFLPLRPQDVHDLRGPVVLRDTGTGNVIYSAEGAEALSPEFARKVAMRMLMRAPSTLRQALAGKVPHGSANMVPMTVTATWVHRDFGTDAAYHSKYALHLPYNGPMAMKRPLRVAADSNGRLVGSKAYITDAPHDQLKHDAPVGTSAYESKMNSDVSMQQGYDFRTNLFIGHGTTRISSDYVLQSTEHDMSRELAHSSLSECCIDVHQDIVYEWPPGAKEITVTATYAILAVHVSEKAGNTRVFSLQDPVDVASTLDTLGIDPVDVAHNRSWIERLKIWSDRTYRKGQKWKMFFESLPALEAYGTLPGSRWYTSTPDHDTRMENTRLFGEMLLALVPESKETFAPIEGAPKVLRFVRYTCSACGTPDVAHARSDGSAFFCARHLPDA